MPSLIAVCQSPDFTVVGVTATTITVQNNAGAPAACMLFCEWWHTVERVFPSAAGALPTTPVIIGETTRTSVARYVPNEMWFHNNVAANENLAMGCLVSPDFNTWRAPRAGSIVGLVARLDGAIATGTLTVQITKNGALLGAFTLALTVGTIESQAIQAAGIDTFVAGDRLGMWLTSSAGFVPGNLHLNAYFEVEEG